MKWLRLHTEARTDRKLDLLTDQQHRIWFNLLCMAGESSERGVVLFESMDLLAIEVARGDMDALTDTLTALERFRMIQNSEGQVAFTHWQERQYDKPSDRPDAVRDRQRRRRDNLKNEDVSRDVTPGNATYTDTDTEDKQKQSRADTEQTLGAKHAPKYASDFEEFWLQYPSGHGNKAKAYGFWKKLGPDDRPLALAGLLRWKSCERWREGYIKSAELWLRDRYFDDEPPPPKRNGNGAHRATDEDIDQWVSDLKQKRGTA